MQDHNNHPNGFTPETWLQTDLIKNWLLHLDSFPEKKGRGKLGEVDKDGNIIEACCLAVVHYLSQGSDCLVEYEDSTNRDINCNVSEETLIGEFEIYGLKDEVGTFGAHLEFLAHLNDNTHTHPEIADFIRANPGKVFDAKLLATKTVAPLPKIWTKDLIAAKTETV